MAINDIAHASWVGNLNGQTVMTGAWFQFLTSTASMDGLATSMQSTLLTLLTAFLSSSVTLTEILVQDSRRDGPDTVHHALPVGTIGTVTGDALPGNCAGLISLRTGLKGRRRRGRVYLPGLSEGNQSGGRITGSQLTALIAYGGGLVGQYGVGGTNADYRLVIYSPADATSVPPKPTTIITPVTTWIADSVVRSQRRRTIGVGQ